MIPIIVDIIQNPPLSGMKRLHGRIMSLMHQAMGVYWQEKFLPIHFQPRAKARYAHKERKRVTKEKKIALAALGYVPHGGRVDAVDRGFLEKALLGRPHVARGYPTRGVVRLPTPAYITMRPRNPDKPNIAAEITTVPPDEMRAMAQYGVEVYEREMKQALAAQTERKRIKG